ncbi:hypothetical protein DNU06_03740 [Putridiphycobacter roseus]|uniref:Lipoprotein n=2 Tax=Putridiphycobacter roseus TaxID=2219161 RepID=A0A2W1N750_9FLAO|nr:hypothetical protein DNU06_03740 [Putridiphycobacter roseus]
MKKKILISLIALFLIGFTSCNKEVIEPSTSENETPFFSDKSVEAPCQSYSDSIHLVTDPNEDEDFDVDKKNTGNN